MIGVHVKCSYCRREATTNDHVVPRCLLEKPYPPNLLTIPSCYTCNTGFKQDEEYFSRCHGPVRFRRRHSCPSSMKTALSTVCSRKAPVSTLASKARYAQSKTAA